MPSNGNLAKFRHFQLLDEPSAACSSKGAWPFLESSSGTSIAPSVIGHGGRDESSAPGWRASTAGLGITSVLVSVESPGDRKSLKTESYRTSHYFFASEML
jgi:hypothetical protein